MADIYELESLDGVRMTWNIWPNSKLEAAKCGIPFSALYTPAKQIASLMTVPYDGVACKQCGAFLNPYVRVDYAAKLWVCPFCHCRNHFPPHYQGISEVNVPAELFPQYTTIEYAVPRAQTPSPPSYLFVIDTCVAEAELAACKETLLQTLQAIPESANVGLITYGTHVHVHELGFQGCPRAHVLRGSKEHNLAAVKDQLGLITRVPRAPAGAPGQPLPTTDPATAGMGRFIAPLRDCEFQLASLLEELQVDPYPVGAELRPLRCTGAALQIATAVVSSSVPPGTAPCRVVLFVGGPATDGPGRIVAPELAEPIRSHKDLNKGDVPHFKAAVKFYQGLSKELVHAGAAVDIFACSLEQVGLAELKVAVERSGGVTILSDTFLNPVFKESLRRVFKGAGDEGSLGKCSQGWIEVIPSRDIKVAGVLGPAAPGDLKEVHHERIAETHVGLGGTNTWRMPGFDSHTTLSFQFEVTGAYRDQQEMMAASASNQQFYIQFITRYLHPKGDYRMRVTTITRRWTDGSNLSDLIAGFDQEAAAVVIGRLCSWKMEAEEDDFDATRWLDRSLIKLCNRFGDYRRDDPSSFQLSPQLSIYPQFMFNFRRSQFVQVFGNSPDETAYHRMALNRETASDAMVMIQPQLTSYSFNGPPEPVLLDVTSIMPDRILLLDAYFYVVVFHGTTVAEWRKAGYQDLPEHAAFAQLLNAAQADAQLVMKDRFPTPRFVDCDQNGSQARFLLFKLNPSSTYSSSQGVGEVIMTDDVSLQVFLEYLRKLAVMQ